MQNVIWSNDTDRIDSIVDYWKEEAARLSEDMAKDPKGTIDDACWAVTDILDRAWKQAISDYELPTAERLIEIIEDLDPSATGIAAHAVDENNADRSSPTAHGSTWNTRHGASTGTTTCATRESRRKNVEKPTKTT